MTDSSFGSEINFLAEKIHVHRWPMDSLLWSQSFSQDIDLHLNKNKEKKKIRIQDNLIHIDNYRFDEIKKIGITVPFFKKEVTMIFEGRVVDSYAHTHITTRAKNYLEIFNSLMNWKNRLFPDS